MHDRLKRVLDKHKILIEFQYGFSEKRGNGTCHFGYCKHNKEQLGHGYVLMWGIYRSSKGIRYG